VTDGPQTRRRADQYDDPSHDYRLYWDGREYEHAAEEIAIRRLLRRDHFRRAIDVGGGFGRLSKLLLEYADSVLLAEPSRQQLDKAETFLENDPCVERQLRQAGDLQEPDSSADLVLCVRVLHHIPDPQAEFDEIARVLQHDGTFVLEFANSANALRRLRLLAQGKGVPPEPISLRTKLPASDAEIPFVNHNPKTVLAQLERSGFVLERKLSGSNVRSPRLKKLLHERALLRVERITQPTLAPLWFGPSIWLRLRKT
jgi:SAM-dependent methyltransferase